MYYIIVIDYVYWFYIIIAIYLSLYEGELRGSSGRGFNIGQREDLNV